MDLKWGGSFNTVERGRPLSGKMFGTVDAPSASSHVSASPEQAGQWLQKRVAEVAEIAIVNRLQAPLSSEQLDELSHEVTELARPHLDEAGAKGPVIILGITLSDGRKFLRPEAAPAAIAPGPALSPAPTFAPLPAPAPVAVAPAAPPTPVALAMEQYASLCVERAMYPDAVPAVAQRYGVLSFEALHAVDAHWHYRFGAEPGLHPRWQHAYQQYEAWLRQQR